MRTELKKGEKKVLVAKKHWFVLVKPALLLGFFLLMTDIYYSDGSGDLGDISLFFTIVAAIHFVFSILAWKNDILVVTNLRVINEFGVFSYNVKECPLDKINNISYRQSLFGRIFNYGDVQIQTAAEMGATTNKFVTSPKLLRDTISKYLDDYKQIQITEQAQKLAQVITSDQKSEADTKECPHCAEIIKSKAKVCRFCGKEVE